MYKPNPVTTETRSAHVNLRLPLRLLARVDDLAEERFLGNRSRAIVETIERGFENLAPSRGPQQED